MPSADESAADRQTYGDAPGWSGNVREEAPAGAPGASPTPDADTASSAEAPVQEQPSEQGTPPTTPAEPERKFNMPPPERWEELRRQREEAERRAQQAEQLAQLALQKLQTPQAPVQETVDPYAGMDPQTAEFWRQLDKRVEQKANALADQKVQGVLQAVDAGRRELAEIKISQFRSANPDIKPNSAEEQAMAGYVSQGMDLNTARKLALFDKQEAELKNLKTKQAAVPRKVAAGNTESSAGIPSGSGLPARQGDWRDKASEILDKGGSVKDILSTVFGGNR